MPGIDAVTDILAAVRDRAAASARFASVALEGERLRCRAKGAEAEAWYVVDRDGGRWSVALLTPDRWLSESVEGDMLEGRDSAEELVDDELVEVGFANRCGKVRHFRDEDKTYVFRTDVPLDGIGDVPAGIVTFLLAFEAAFGQLGDMGGGD
jgi:hypothetical protein